MIYRGHPGYIPGFQVYVEYVGRKTELPSSAGNIAHNGHFRLFFSVIVHVSLICVGDGGRLTRVLQRRWLSLVVRVYHNTAVFARWYVVIGGSFEVELKAGWYLLVGQVSVMRVFRTSWVSYESHLRGSSDWVSEAHRVGSVQDHRVWYIFHLRGQVVIQVEEL